MNKSFVFLALVALTCVSALHMQTFAPSKPGGTYYGANGTSSGGSANGTYPNYPSYPTYPTQPTYPRQPSYPSYPTQPTYPSYPSQPTYPSYPNQPSYNSSTTGVLVNGQPYYFTGPFRLVCYVQGSTQIFRQDSCYDATTCANLLNQYRNCIGTVKKFNL